MLKCDARPPHVFCFGCPVGLNAHGGSRLASRMHCILDVEHPPPPNPTPTTLGPPLPPSAGPTHPLYITTSIIGGGSLNSLQGETVYAGGEFATGECCASGWHLQ